jgi:hypothetical protein
MASYAAFASTLDVVVVFDRTQWPVPRGAADLPSAIAGGDRMAVTSYVPEFRIHTTLTDDADLIEQAIIEAVSSSRTYASRRPRLYEAARRAADLFDDAPARHRAVMFITFNRQNPSEKQTRELIDLYRSRGIRLEVIVLASSQYRSGVRGTVNRSPDIFCDPGPGCPPLGATDPDLGTLDRVAVATGGRVWRVAANGKIDWQALLAEIRSAYQLVNDPSGR